MVEINTTAATVLDRESVTLYCKATGKPHPTLTWTIAGSPVVLSNNAILTTGPLKRNDTINDLIQYQCTASNGVERPTTAFTKITVYCEYDLHSEGIMESFFKQESMTKKGSLIKFETSNAA